MIVFPAKTVCMTCCMSLSVATSTDDVASSRIRMWEFRRKALAKENNCKCAQHFSDIAFFDTDKPLLQFKLYISFIFISQ